jgi:acetyl-CoA decarbonylase/synthase complex subunit gamma
MMALSGIQIFKLLPKTNCKDCGAPTCLAFAMNLAANKAELRQCPHLSHDANRQLAMASAPPVRKLILGNEKNIYNIGELTVLYRHEKTFNNRPLLAAVLDDDHSELQAIIAKWQAQQWLRIGMVLRGEMIFLQNRSQDAQVFVSAIKTIEENSDFILTLAARPAVLRQALPALDKTGYLLYAADENNFVEMCQLAAQYKSPLVVRADDLDALAALTQKISELGINDMVLDCQADSLAQVFMNNVAITRSALLDKNQALGYPIINFARNGAKECPYLQTAAASMMIDKYGGIVVLQDFSAASLFSLLLLRLNIYTDPQRPMTMPEGIYPISGPDANSPVCITTNFSLTYFMINGEIENARVPTWLLIMDTEGLSVLTAWAAGKFVGDSIADFVKKSGIAEKIKHRRLIIPGYVASLQTELQEWLSDWQIIVGPRESTNLPKFLKN